MDDKEVKELIHDHNDALLLLGQKELELAKRGAIIRHMDTHIGELQVKVTELTDLIGEEGGSNGGTTQG